MNRSPAKGVADLPPWIVESGWRAPSVRGWWMLGKEERNYGVIPERIVY